MRESELYKEVFGKVDMKDSVKKYIRTSIEASAEPKRKYVDKQVNMAMRWAIAAVAVAAFVCCIPQARSGVYAAAGYICELFTFANGSEVEIVDMGYETSAAVEVMSEDEDYVYEENGRVYFILDDVCTDVTEAVASEGYYRYETKLEDGGRSVIFIGGESGAYGWVELLFDAEGNYVANWMHVKDGVDWVDIAMHAEGVPTGNPEYDSKLK